MTTFTYDTITDAQRLEVSEYQSKLNALDEQLRLIQVERGTQEDLWRARERDISTEKQRIEELLRKHQGVTIS